MPRDSSGNYSLPAGNPVVSGTTIASTWANPTMSDLGTEIQNSLDRQGRGGMTAALKLDDGTEALPGLSFVTDPDSGLRRVGANALALVVGAADKVDITSSGVVVTGTFSSSGALTVTSGGLTVTAGGLTVTTGGATIGGNTSVTGTLSSTSTLTVSAGGASIAGSITVTGTVDGRDLATDGTKLDGIASGANNYTHPNHTGQVTSTGDGATALAASAITAQTALTTGLAGTDELLVSDAGVLKRMDVSVMNAYFNSNLSFNNYSHPNHTGHVTSTGDGATVLTVSAITGQTELASGLVSTDELVVSDGGVIKRMDMSVVDAYVKSGLLNSAGSAPVFGVRCFVYCNPSIGTVTGSGNVSSITDHGAGNFTVNFTTSFPSTTYGIGAVVRDTETNGDVMVGRGSADTTATTACEFRTFDSAGNTVDSTLCHLIFVDG